jgi:Bacterial protein of unknown function (DUF922)
VKKYLILQMERYRRWKAASGNSPAMRAAKRNQERDPQRFSWAKVPNAVWVLLYVGSSGVLFSLCGDDERSGLHVTREVDTFTVIGSRLEDLSPNPESGDLQFVIGREVVAGRSDPEEDCEVSRVLVTVDLTYNLPHWSSVPYAERDRWNRFLQAQRAYLDRIAEIWIESGRERLRAFRQLSHASCNELNARIDTTNDAIHDRSSAQHWNLIWASDNGRTMGAYIPWPHTKDPGPPWHSRRAGFSRR